MPRAATAIIAIACSTSYLGPEAHSISPVHPVRCDAKSKRIRSWHKRGVSKQPLISELETLAKQEETPETILARLVSWSPSDIGKLIADIEASNDVDSDIDTVSEAGDDIKALSDDDNLVSIVSDVEALTPTRSRSKASQFGALPAIGALPEEVLFTALKYTGAAARAVCRAAQRSCDQFLRDNLLLPTFPVNVCVKQHYHFNPHRPVTTTWSLDVEAPSTPCSLEVGTESGSEDTVTAHQSSLSGEQVLRLCQEVRSLQTQHGAQHKEAGRTQVEVVATDAAGRKLLEHAYDHSIFWSKADDLLELLTESELHVSSTPSTQSPQSSDDERPPRSARARPASRSR